MAEPDMKSIAIILMKPPYGSINAAEAVRHALGAVGEDLDVSLILADSGVLAAVRGQDPGKTGFISLESSIGDCINMGVGVYADKASLRDKLVEESDIVEGIKVVNGSEVSTIVGEADGVMIF